MGNSWDDLPVKTPRGTCLISFVAFKLLLIHLPCSLILALLYITHRIDLQLVGFLLFAESFGSLETDTHSFVIAEELRII